MEIGYGMQFLVKTKMKIWENIENFRWNKFIKREAEAH